MVGEVPVHHVVPVAYPPDGPQETVLRVLGLFRIEKFRLIQVDDQLHIFWKVFVEGSWDPDIGVTNFAGPSVNFPLFTEADSGRSSMNLINQGKTSGM